MTRQNVNGSVLTDVVLAGGTQLQSFAQVLTGPLTLQANLPPVMILDPGGAARNVLLPAEAEAMNHVLWIVNNADAAELITLRDDADAATIGTVAQNKSVMLHCDGVTWRVLSSVS